MISESAVNTYYHLRLEAETDIYEEISLATEKTPTKILFIDTNEVWYKV
jgi:hypothetical protein